jgi:hypothetical protein
MQSRTLLLEWTLLPRVRLWPRGPESAGRNEHRCSAPRRCTGQRAPILVVSAQRSLKIARCRSMSLDVARCRSMSLDVARCRSIAKTFGAAQSGGLCRINAARDHPLDWHLPSSNASCESAPHRRFRRCVRRSTQRTSRPLVTAPSIQHVRHTRASTCRSCTGCCVRSQRRSAPNQADPLLESRSRSHRQDPRQWADPCLPIQEHRDVLQGIAPPRVDNCPAAGEGRTAAR